jgi:hypothetical protein
MDVLKSKIFKVKRDKPNQRIKDKLLKVLNIIEDKQAQIDELFDHLKEQEQRYDIIKRKNEEVTKIIDGNAIFKLNQIEADIKTLKEKFKPAKQEEIESNIKKLENNLTKKLEKLETSFNTLINPLSNKLEQTIKNNNTTINEDRLMHTRNLQNKEMTEKIAYLLEIFLSYKATIINKTNVINDRLQLDNQDIRTLQIQNMEDPRNQLDKNAKQYIDNLTFATAEQAKVFAMKKEDTDQLFKYLSINTQLSNFFKTYSPNSLGGLKMALKQLDDNGALLEILNKRINSYYSKTPTIPRGKDKKHKPTREIFKLYKEQTPEEEAGTKDLAVIYFFTIHEDLSPMKADKLTPEEKQEIREIFKRLSLFFEENHINNDTSPLEALQAFIKFAEVDGINIKEDTFYTLKDGEICESEG